MIRRSAGVLLYRRPDPGTGETEVLLGHLGGPFWAKRHARGWGVIKGELEGSEDPIAAARREFREELGIPPPDGRWRDLGEVRVSGGKRIQVWAVAGDLDPAAISPGTFELEWPPHSGRMQEFPEVDRVAWWSLTDARELIIAGQLPFLDRLTALFDRPPS